MRFNHYRLWIICLLSLLLVSLAMAQSAKVKSLLIEAEKLHDAKDYQGTMAKLQEAEKLDKDNPEILWKVARA
jgi:outer membrane lipoprotein-sorting protein